LSYINNKLKRYSLFLTIAFVFYYVVGVGDRQETLRVITNSPLGNDSPSQECDTDICLVLLKMISQADDSIDFAVYGLRGQSAILNALVAAQERGVVVRGVIDKDIHNRSYYSDTHLLEEHLDNIRSDYRHDIKVSKLINNKRKPNKDKCMRPDGHVGPLQCFEGKGYASKKKITFKGDIMHNKFFVVDNERVWTGSSNISDTGTGGYNANIVTVIDSSFFAKFYTAEFEQMFVEGDFHRSKKRFKKEEISKEIEGQKVNLHFSPQGYAMYKGIIPLIKEAENSIDIAVFFLTHKNVSKELVVAKKRGVDVRVIIDATAATNGYSKHHYLRENGIPVKVENWGGKMHMKSAIVDGEHLIIGSMNWTSAGESKNDENTLIIRSAGENAEIYQDFFNHLWRSIPDQWLLADPAAESKDSGTSCRDGIDNDFDKEIDGNDSGCSGFLGLF